jgi:hypothetical protein
VRRRRASYLQALKQANEPKPIEAQATSSEPKYGPWSVQTWRCTCRMVNGDRQHRAMALALINSPSPNFLPAESNTRYVGYQPAARIAINQVLREDAAPSSRRAMRLTR